MISSFIKLFGINICTSYCFYKIINYKNVNFAKTFFILCINIILSIIATFWKTLVSPFFFFIITYILFNLILSFLTQNKFGYSLIVIILSISIIYIIYTISSFFYAFIELLCDFRINNIFTSFCQI